MALVIKDRVKETTLSEGVGTITFAGASAGFNSFSDIGNANTTYYCIAGSTSWEVGIGTYTLTGTTLSRDTVLSNSLGTTAKINFSAGSKDVFCTYPSSKAILGNTSALTSTGTGSVVFSASPTLTGTVVLPKSSFGATATVVGNESNTVLIGQPALDVNNTITIGNITASPDGGSFSTINIGASYFDDTIIVGGPTITNILGDVNFDPNAFLSFGNGTFTSDLAVSGSLTVSSRLNLIGSAIAVQNIATSQTTGTLNVGGANATGAITLGRSTGTQTVNLATGVNTGTKTVNIGANASSGATNINIGATTGTCIVTVRGTLRQQTYLVANLPAGVVGACSFVTNALAPTFGMAVVGGGAVGIPVYHDGVSWKVG